MRGCFTKCATSNTAVDGGSGQVKASFDADHLDPTPRRPQRRRKLQLYQMFYALLVLITLAGTIIYTRIAALRVTNAVRKAALLKTLGVTEPASKRIVGFFHPYW